MGTRSTTKIYDEYKDTKGKTQKSMLLALYRQFDGYTKGMGQDLKDFINKCIIVNGFNPEQEKEGKILCNGSGCFALQLVKEFKEDTGGIYATTEDDEQEYNYEIIFRTKQVHGFGSYIEIELVCNEEPEFNQIYDIADDGSVSERGC